MNTLSTQAMDIVTDGKSRAVIVLPDAPSAVARYAAGELQTHIQKATAVKLEIVPERISLTFQTNCIYVGPCAATEQAGIRVGDLPKNAFRIKITGAAMFLVGHDGDGTPPGDDGKSQGTLFAVYDWLDKQVGVRWLWPGELGTVVPQYRQLTSGRRCDRTMQPPFIHTRLRFGLSFNWDMVSQAGRERYVRETSEWLRRHQFARTVTFEYGHAYEKYWERFGRTHPDYFALRPDGKRGPIDERTDLVQMCVSNPDLHRQIIADWLEQRKREPDRPWINGCENDSRTEDSPCTCPRCRAWDAKGSTSLSDRYARFWLALQAEARKYDPEATVIGLAYAGYTAPPVNTKLNDHIIVGIVPDYYFPLDTQHRQAFRALWGGWAKTGARLFLRPNYFLEGFCMPYIFANQFGGEFKHAWRNRMIATDFDSLTGMWGVQGPNLYLLGRLNERPVMSVAAVLDEYYAGFGPAAREVRAYSAYWERVTQQKDEAFNKTHGGGWSMMSYDGDAIYTPATFQTGRDLLEKARRAAAKDPLALKRVQFLAVWLEHAELSMVPLRAFHAAKRQRTPEVVAAQKQLDQFRQAHAEELAACHRGVLNQVEIWSGWRTNTGK